MPPKRAKRAKLEAPTCERNAATNGLLDKHEAFTRWAQDQGVEIDGVKPAKLPGRGFGLVTIKHVSEGQRLLFVPEKAMFKPISRNLKSHGLQNVSPQAQLAVSLLMDSTSDKPHLTLWKATWPTQLDFIESLPLRWPAEARELLPPSVEQPLRRQQDDFDKDFESVKVWLQNYGWKGEDWYYVWSIVNSRSFHWKPPKGKAGAMVMCPFIDYMNHGPTDITCNVLQHPDGYAVYANRDYEAGEEVLATYGAHSNDKLLVHYGFVCASGIARPNPDDDIRLDHVLLPQLSKGVYDQLQDVGFLGAYALTPTTNELCFKTQVAVRAQLLTANEWEYFMTNGEDLANDQTTTVNHFVSRLLRDYSKEAAQKAWRIDELRREGKLNETRASLLRERWMQIDTAIKNFTGLSG